MEKEKKTLCDEIFSKSKQAGIIVLSVEENNNIFKFFIADTDHTCLDSFKHVLESIIPYKQIKQEYAFDIKAWILYAEITTSDITSHITDNQVDLVQADATPEEDKKPQIVKQDSGITVYDDGSIEIELVPWKFSVLPKEQGDSILLTNYLGIIQIFDWVTLVGLFLGDKEFADNELVYPTTASGRWIIKGIAPDGSEFLYDIRDYKGGDVPYVYGQSRTGLGELIEWLVEYFKDKDPITYSRKVRLSNGTVGSFGIDSNGDKFYSWSRVGWLEELGLYET